MTNYTMPNTTEDLRNNERNTIHLSHVLYLVKDLHKAVRQLRDAGFIVAYGTRPERAYNAMIWFEEGVFIEIFRQPRMPGIVKWFLKKLGYKPIIDRMDKWQHIGEGWCEWSLESDTIHLDNQKAFLKSKNIPFRFHRAKRKDSRGLMLRWQLLIPHAIDFPFLMSAYDPNPRPQKISHPNGVTGVSELIIGKANLDTILLKQLLPDHTGIELLEDTRGLQTVKLKNSGMTIEQILR